MHLHVVILSSTLFAASQLSLGCNLARATQSSSLATVQHTCSSIKIPERVVTAIKNVRIFDGWQLGDPRTLVIDGDQIGSNNAATLLRVRKTIDGTGKFLIPGLMDTHVHPPDCTALSQLASYGITTAFNMACNNYTICHVLKNQDGVADYITAGLASCAKTFDASTTDNLEERAWAAVVANSSDFYKICAETNGPTPAQQDGLVAAVHRFGKQTMTHAPSILGYEQAIESRTDGIQHTPDDGLLTDDQIALIVTQGQFVTPTMEIFRFGFNNPVIAATLGHKAGGNSNETFDNVKANVAAMHVAGVPITAGTDAVGLYPGVANVPFGITLHCELEDLVDVGFTPAQALRAATFTAAQVHRLSDRGAVEVGKRADLVLLNSNPLANISNTRDIARVWVNGIEFEDVAESEDNCASIVADSSVA